MNDALWHGKERINRVPWILGPLKFTQVHCKWVRVCLMWFLFSNMQIQVEDLNDCAPTFPEDPVHFSIAEDIPQGTVVWTFAAQDLDSGDNGKVCAAFY